MLSNNSHPKQLCEDCTTELVMVAKFREKCGMSTAALEQLKRKINKMKKDDSDRTQAASKSEQNYSTDAFYESIDVADENVEYIIYDAITETAEESDIQDKSEQSIVQYEDDSTDEDETFCENTVATEVCGSLVSFVANFLQFENHYSRSSRERKRAKHRQRIKNEVKRRLANWIWFRSLNTIAKCVELALLNWITIQGIFKRIMTCELLGIAVCAWKLNQMYSLQRIGRDGWQHWRRLI